MNPFFSVIIPLYNKANHIENTILNVLNQTFSNFEVIIVNDGSTDHSLDVVKNIKDSRIKIFTTKNQGVSVARNFGISKAQAEYIAFLDADDIWLKHHLENHFELIQKFPDCGMYCSAYTKQYKDHNSKSVYNNIPSGTNWQGIITNYFNRSLKNSIAWTSATVVPKYILDALNGFDESITLGAGEDTDLWIRIALNHDVAFNNNISALHNLKAENRLSKTQTQSRQFINLDKYEPLTINNPDLKTYLDLNRFSIGMQYKRVGEVEIANSYFAALNKTSLNKKQRFLMKSNQATLLVLKKIQDILRWLKIDLTPFH